MCRKGFVSIALLAAVLTTAVGAARADSPAELLEKGIYAEETVGNLEEAISIYGQVVAEAKANQALAAQAQLRLAQCLLKQDKKTEAKAAFEKLIADYPDQKELVAEARKHVPDGLPMGPVPWIDGEVMRLDMRLGNGMEIGPAFNTIQSAQRDGQKVWRVGGRTLAWGGRVRGGSYVDADWDTFQPIYSHFKMNMLGEYIVQYSPNHLLVTSEGADGKQTKTVEETKVVYDNEQCSQVIRRLPLAPDYKTTVPVFAAMGAGDISIPLEVRGTETIKVPAGEFECFKVHLGLVNQDFWYSTDEHRYLVKIEAMSVIMELGSIDKITPGESRQYENADLGFSLTMPSEWLFGNAGGNIAICDPRMVAESTVTAVKKADLKPEQQKSVQDWAKGEIDGFGKDKQKFKIRTGDGDARAIAGLPGANAIAFTTDYADGKRAMVGYFVFVQNETAAIKFMTFVASDDFEEFQKPFDAIIDSLKAKQP